MVDNWISVLFIIVITEIHAENSRNFFSFLVRRKIRVVALYSNPTFHSHTNIRY